MTKQTTTKQKDEQTDNHKTLRRTKRQPQNRKMNKQTTTKQKDEQTDNHKTER